MHDGTVSDGVGGDVSAGDMREAKRTAKILQRAANEDWPVDGEARELGVIRMKEALKIVPTADCDLLTVVKAQTAATMALVSMDKVNLQAKDVRRNDALAGLTIAQALANMSAEERAAMVADARRTGILPPIPGGT